MEGLIVLGVVVLTSFVGCFIGWVMGRASISSAKNAIDQFLEYIGTFVICFGINAMMIVAIALIMRFLGWQFLSPYIAGSSTLLLFSAAQALIFHLHRASN